VLDDVQTAESVISCVVPSESEPMAVNCCLLPAGMLVVVGETEIETRVAAVTVSCAAGVEVTPENKAVMSVVPVPFDSTSPNEPEALPTVATDGDDELQSEKVVRFWVDPPVSVPTAINCREVPSAMLALAGVTAIDVTAEDVSDVVPVTVSRSAVIIIEPVVEDTVLARPVTEMVTIAASDELQVTNEVRSCVAPF
jgi:hypothetical protein